MSELKDELIARKKLAEAMYVTCLYRDLDLWYESELSMEDIHTEPWSTMNRIAEIAVKNKKKVMTDIEVGAILQNHYHLSDAWKQGGGWKTIEQAMNFTKQENFESFIETIKKFNALLLLDKKKFLTRDMFERYKDMSLEEIYVDVESTLSTAFQNTTMKEKIVAVGKNVKQMIKDAHAGVGRGMPFSCGFLTKRVNGMGLGTLYLHSMATGAGKTTTTIAWLLPHVLKTGEKMTIIANEEDLVAWEQAILTWIVNNLLGGNFEKSRWGEGDFSAQELEWLDAAGDMLLKWNEDETLEFINLSSFNMTKTIQIIKSQTLTKDCRYYILDTLKLDAEGRSVDGQSWLQLQQNMVRLFDIIKPASLNNFVWCTYQLSKGAVNRRFLDQGCLGVSRSVADVAAVLFLGRQVLQSELKGGKTPLKVKNPSGDIIELPAEFRYLALFTGKNRRGKTDKVMIYAIDHGRMVIQYVGETIIEEDY